MSGDDAREKWAAYRSTVLELPADPGGGDALRVDLRRPIPGALRARLEALGIASPVAIFTAENPHGQNAEDEASPRVAARGDTANLERTVTLVETLRATGRPTVRVDGMAPDGSYRERCVAVSMTRDEAREIARRLEQLAFFWFDGARMWLVPGLADEAMEELPHGDDERAKPAGRDPAA